MCSSFKKVIPCFVLASKNIVGIEPLFVQNLSDSTVFGVRSMGKRPYGVEVAFVYLLIVIF